MLRSVLVGLLFLLPAFPALAQAPEKITSVEGITEYRLANGLRFLLFPDPSKPVVTVNMTVMVGSRHEGYGETGMAHLLEHMLFKGSPAFPNVPKALSEHGARDFNGTTWLDRTNYYETMPASDENLEFGIQLEADRLVNSFVRRDDLISEMTVVRNEFEMGENDPEQILSQRIIATAYEWHNYGKSTIGNRSDIERVPIENLQAFYRKFYQVDNAVLVLAGKFDEKKAIDLIVKHFGPLKKPARQLPTTYTEEPPQDGERFVTLRRVGTVAATGAAYHVPAGSHPDFPAVEVLAHILGDEPGGRLYKALVEPKLASKVIAAAFALHDPGLVEVGATCEPKNLDTVREKLIGTLEDLPSHPITAEEVDRAKTQMLKQREDLISDSKRVAIQLSEWASKGDWRLFFLHRDRLEKVTPEDVNRVAATYFIKSNRTVGVFIPTEKPVRASVPAAPNLVKALEGYVGRKTIATGEVFDPTPANLDARLKKETIGNIKVGLLPRKTRGETATVQIALRFGSLESLTNKRHLIELLGDMLERGTKNNSRQQFKDKLDKLGAQLTVTSDAGLLMVTVKAKRENLGGALTLVTEMLREPAFPEKELELLKGESIDQLDKGRTDPMQLAIREMQRKAAPYPKGHPLHTPTFEEEIALIKLATLDEIKTLYTEQVSAQAGEVAALGDFDAEAVMKQLKSMLGGWTAKVPHVRIPRPAFPNIAGSKTDINTPDKANAMYLAVMTFPVGDADADAVPLEVGNYMFGGASLSSRLAGRVRGKEGLSYGVNSVYSASPRDPASRYLMYAITNPTNIDKVTDIIGEELTKYLAEGPSVSELNDALKGYLESKKVARTNDGQLALQLVNNLNLGRDFAFEEKQEQKAAAVQVDEIKAAWRKHIDPKKLIIIRAGDFGKKDEKK